MHGALAVKKYRLLLWCGAPQENREVLSSYVDRHKAAQAYLGNMPIYVVYVILMKFVLLCGVETLTL